MVSVLVLILALVLGLLITRIATRILVATGMSFQYAKFQARSAFTGVGFTTTEAEQVVNHPVRRRVVMSLMLMGNLGIATLVVTLLGAFNVDRGSDALYRVGVILLGVLLVWRMAASEKVDHWIKEMMATFMEGRPNLRLRDYAGLLQVASNYDIGELSVREGDWLAGKSLARLRLSDEGVIVLGIERGGGYEGTPRGDFVIQPGDILILYGRQEVLADLDDRRSGMSGELIHVDRVAEQRALDARSEEDGVLDSDILADEGSASPSSAESGEREETG